MKKLVLALAFVAGAVSMNAQNVHENVSLSKSETSCTASAGGVTMEISPVVYRQLKAHEGDYVIVQLKESRNYGQATTLAKRSNVQSEELVVKSVGLSEDEATAVVTFTSGEVFRGPCKDGWDTVIAGQKVKKFTCNGITKNITTYRTVDSERALALSD